MTDDLTRLESEPVALPTVLTGALTATVNVIAIVADISGEVVATVNIAIGAWVGVLAFIMRSKVVSLKALSELAPPDPPKPPEFP